MTKKIFLITYFLIFLITIFFFEKGNFKILEEKILDIKYRFKGPYSQKSQVVLVGITDDCFKKLGEWPFPRSRYATVINRIKELGAKTIALDIIFDLKNTNEPDGDTKLINAVKNAGNVILSYAVNKTKTLVFDDSDNSGLPFKDTFTFLKPFDELDKASHSRGLINAEIDPMNKDGITRKLLYSFNNENKEYLGFSFVIASHFLGKKINIKSYWFDKYTKYFYINYFDHTQIETVPFKNFFDDKEIKKMRAANTFKDKAVIIGPAFSEKDYYYTPFGRTRGMRLHADTINSIYYNEFISSASNITNIILALLMMSVSYLLFTHFKWGYIYSIISGLIYFALSLYSFKWFGYIFDVMPVISIVFVGSTVSLFINLYYKLWEANLNLRKRVKELTVLYDISNQLSQTQMSEQDKRIKLLIEKSTSAIDALRGSVMILDPFTEELEVKAVFDENFKRFRKGIKLKIGQGIAGKVALTGKPIVIDNVDDDERFIVFSDKDKGIKSLLTVPMITHNKVIGVLNFVNKSHGMSFNDADLKLAVTIAQSAANIIENARLYREATIDGMTGLYVHRFFQRRLEEELQRARRYNKNLSLIMTDIDHFKSFNDTYGHQIGDFVLTGVAQIIKDAVRDIDVPARYGGEEFIVILPETTQQGAHILAERIRTQIENTDFKTDSGVLRVTISVGVSTYPETQVELAKEFVKTADEAMYEAKETGRNKTVVFNKKD